MHERMPIQFILWGLSLGPFLSIYFFFQYSYFSDHCIIYIDCIIWPLHHRGSFQNYFNFVEMNILLFFPFAMIFAFDCTQFPGIFFSTRVSFGIGFFWDPESLCRIPGGRGRKTPKKSPLQNPKNLKNSGIGIWKSQKNFYPRDRNFFVGWDIPTKSFLLFWTSSCVSRMSRPSSYSRRRFE